MEEKRTSSVWIVAVVLIAVPLAAYVGGYFVRSEVVDLGGSGHRSAYARFYPSAWEADIFYPAGRVESFVTGATVYTTSEVFIPVRH